MRPDTKIIITLGDLVNIHDDIYQLQVAGESTLRVANIINGLRNIMSNPVVAPEPAPEEEVKEDA